MNIKYQCKNCAIFFKNQIDLNYHWIDCRKESKEDENYEWLEKNNFKSFVVKFSSKENLQSKRSINNISILNKLLVICPDCNVLVRSDRLQEHIKNIHTSASQVEVNSKNFLKSVDSKIKIVETLVSPVFQKKKNKKKSRVKSRKLQSGKIIESQPTTKFGEKAGVVLKQEESNGVKIRYEQSLCSCNGNNERCMRCDGTGYYVKKIIENSDLSAYKLYNKAYAKYNSKTTQESGFSNDSRGGFYGVREQGRFVSNPLHDDHD